MILIKILRTKNLSLIFQKRNQNLRFQQQSLLLLAHLSSSDEIQKLVDEQSAAGAEILKEEWVGACVKMIEKEQASIETIVPQDEVDTCLTP